MHLGLIACHVTVVWATVDDGSHPSPSVLCFAVQIGAGTKGALRHVAFSMLLSFPLGLLCLYSTTPFWFFLLLGVWRRCWGSLFASGRLSHTLFALIPATINVAGQHVCRFSSQKVRTLVQ